MVRAVRLTLLLKSLPSIDSPSLHGTPVTPVRGALSQQTPDARRQQGLDLTRDWGLGTGDSKSDFVYYCHVGEVPVLAVEVEAVADHELGADVEALVGNMERRALNTVFDEQRCEF